MLIRCMRRRGTSVLSHSVRMSDGCSLHTLRFKTPSGTTPAYTNTDATYAVCSWWCRLFVAIGCPEDESVSMMVMMMVMMSLLNKLASNMTHRTSSASPMRLPVARNSNFGEDSAITP